MISVNIMGDGHGKDICEVKIAVEEEFSENMLIHLMAQLKEVNDTVLEAMIESGFHPDDISKNMHILLLHTLTDFREKNGVKV